MPVPPRDALGPGEVVGPYRLLREIGVGGMGRVYEAVEETLDRVVAVKVIAPELADDPRFRVELHREAQAQAALDSPHVVQVLGHGESDGRLYIALQLVPDGDLAVLLARHGPLPLRAAVDVVAQVADGLAEAHRVGLVHRDVKPANVLLRRRGDGMSAYLTDFGIARPITGDPAPSGVLGAAPGTPTYLAPEVYDGRPAGPAADIYALGGVLWTALTGTAPYRIGSGQGVHALAVAHRSAPIPQLGGDGLRGRVDAVLRMALAKDPADRFVSAAAMRDELRSILEERTGRVPRPVRTPVAAVAVVLLGLAGGLLLHHDGHRSAPPQGTTSAVTALVAELRRSGLDSVTARCVARNAAGRRQDVFAAAYRCLWPTEVTSR